MGLLEGMPKTAAEAKKKIEAAEMVFEQIWDLRDHSALEENMRRALEDGRSLADVVGLTKEQRDSLFVQGCRLLQVGDIDKAQEWLAMLHLMDPLDERVTYALGMATQLQGKLDDAAKLYIEFLAIDATNPEGYNRLGECFLANKEIEQAAGFFEAAINMCRGGHGTPTALEHAMKMFAVAKEQLSVN